jgi:hypothetical protein
MHKNYALCENGFSNALEYADRTSGGSCRLRMEASYSVTHGTWTVAHQIGEVSSTIPRVLGKSHVQRFLMALC